MNISYDTSAFYVSFHVGLSCLVNQFNIVIVYFVTYDLNL